MLRQGPSDAEAVYSIFKLLHRVGTLSPEGRALVASCKEQWSALRPAFLARAAAGARGGQATAVATPLFSSLS